MRINRLTLTVLCAIAMCGVTVQAADEMSVQVKKTQVRDKGSYLGKTLYDLHYGDRVLVLQRGAAWYKVRPVEVDDLKLKNESSREVKDLTGYLNKSALSTKRIVLKADQNAEVMASSENVILAGKGFNDDVESSYKSKHPNLAAAFAELDAIEMDSTYSPTAEEVNAFRAEGGLEGGEE